MSDRGGVGKALATRLAKLGVEVLDIDGAPDAEALEATIAEWTAAGPIQGVYWLAALDDEGPLQDLDPAAGARRCASASSASPSTMRALYDASTFLVAGTRLGGCHGYDEAGATASARRRRDRLRQGATRASGPTRWSRPSTSRRAARPRRSPTC